MPPIPPNIFVIARALDRLAILHPNNDLIRRLSNLPAADLPGALILLSPEDFAVIFDSGFSIIHVQLDNIEHRLWDVRQGATGFSDSAPTVADTRPTDGKDTLSMDGKEVMSSAPERTIAPDHRWGFFITGTGELVDVENTNRARGASFNTGGVTAGVDYRVTEHFVLGIAFGYAATSADLNFGGHLDGDSGKANLYATYYDHGFYVNGIVGGGYSSLDTRRLTAGGFARGETDGVDFDALIGTGYDYHIGRFSFGPLASLRYARVGIDGFNERGALGALWIDTQDEDSLRSALGLQASYSAKVGSITLTPFLRAQWQHEFLHTNSSIDAGFTSADFFTVEGPHIGRDGLLLDAGISAQLTRSVGIYGYYSGELARENYKVHSINLGLRVSF